jgi:hypothetical protein
MLEHHETLKGPGIARPFLCAKMKESTIALNSRWKFKYADQLNPRNSFFLPIPLPCSGNQVSLSFVIYYRQQINETAITNCCKDSKEGDDQLFASVANYLQ